MHTRVGSGLSPATPEKDVIEVNGDEREMQYMLT
jgi:hypothetical protein